MGDVLEVPCACRVNSMMDPDWEGFPCACTGAGRVMTQSGEIGVWAIVRDPYAEDPEEAATNELAEFILHGRETLSLPDYLAELRRRAQERLGRR